MNIKLRLTANQVRLLTTLLFALALVVPGIAKAVQVVCEQPVCSCCCTTEQCTTEKCCCTIQPIPAPSLEDKVKLDKAPDIVSIVHLPVFEPEFPVLEPISWTIKQVPPVKARARAPDSARAPPSFC